MLAIDGGRPLRTEPLPKRALFREAEREAAMGLFDAAIGSGNAIGYGGPEEAAYEAAFVDFHGGGFADLVNSGTSAVYTALGGLELAPAGEVVVPPITDPGGVMPVALLNLIPVVADAAPGSFNTSAKQIAAVLTPHTRALLVAHIAGEPADMDPILELARSRGLPVIEDCAQSHGARYHGRLVGTLGTVAAFSTMSGKHHATGPQGGVVFSQNEEVGWRCKRFADRGKPLGLEGGTNVRAGLNLNGNDLSAAVGRAQLRKLPAITKRRQQAAEGVREGVADLKAVAVGWQVPDTDSAYWFMRIHVDETKLTVDKNGFARAVAAEGIPLSPTYGRVISEATWFRERKIFGTSTYPWGLQDYKGDRNAQFPCDNARESRNSHFALRVHESWGDQEVRDAVAAMAKVEAAYLK